MAKEDLLKYWLQKVYEKYFFQGLDDTTTASVTYIGRSRNDGTWLISSMDETTGIVMLYANVGNNSGYKTYATAWAARDSLNYVTIENLSGI